MIMVLLFTLSVLVAIWTHSILIWIICIILCGMASLVLRLSLTTAIVYLLSIVSWWWSVVVYDMIHTHSTSTVSVPSFFLVIEQQRNNRYRILWDDQEFLLYTQSSLQPWTRFQSTRQIVWIEYDKNWCLIRCRDLYWQTGQVMDSESFDYDGWMYMQGLHWSLYDDTPLIIGQDPVDTRTTLRTTIKEHIIQVLWSDTVWALWLGMLIGERSLFEKTVYQSFIESGLVHLVAVSGGNIAIMIALASLVLFWVPFYIRMILLIIVVLWYSYLVGTDSSVIRATLMALLTLVALFPGRQLSIWRLLSYARVLMLLRNPYYLVYDLWFLLSFGALLGIVWADKVVFAKLRTNNKDWHSIIGQHNRYSWQRWREQWWNLLRIIVLPSIGAMIGVLPILIWNTGQINLLSPLFNIVIVPFVPLLTSLLVLLALWPVSWIWSIVGRMLWLIAQLAQIGTDYGLVLAVERLPSGLIGSVMIVYWIWWIAQEVKRG